MKTKDKVIIPALAGRQLLQLAQSRARVYGILAVICAGLPGERLVRLFSDWNISENITRDIIPPGMKRGLATINNWLERHGSEPSEIAALEIEFTRLFRGLDRAKSPPPPYESVYLDSGLLYGPSAQRVAEIYRRFQVAARDNEPPDYIALELDFMRLLCEKEALAWRSRDNNVRELLAAENDFLREHLTAWAPVFCESVRKYDAIAFYAGLVDITEGWLLCDQEVIADLCVSDLN
ncbi:MAG: hypothetical protein A2144_07805 [Chloroflexi bacterium RBG_16_50_9]|nr:MAG: hypothetical protein A2144_07805 [Chloroflexi bacterium RBG_16_50_9]